MSFVQDDAIMLNEENIEYKWADIDEFVRCINWDGDKEELKKVLKSSLRKEVYFKKEQEIEFNTSNTNAK